MLRGHYDCWNPLLIKCKLLKESVIRFEEKNKKSLTDTMSSSDEHSEQELDKGATKRINSTLGFNNLGEKPETGGQKSNDPYRMLERSQSEAVLLHKNDVDQTDISLGLLEAAQSAEELSPSGGFGQSNVSECTRVYYDLSKAEAYESITERGPNFLIRTASGRQLETIPQDEELRTGDLHDNIKYSLSERSVSMESTSSLSSIGSSMDEKSPRSDRHFNLRSASSKEEMRSASFASASSTTSTRKQTKPNRSQDHLNKIAKSNLKSTFQSYAQNLKQKMKPLQMGSVQEQITALKEISILMEQVWAFPVYGKDLAYGLCDIFKAEGALDLIIKNCSSQTKDIFRGSARLLEKVLTTGIATLHLN